MPRHLNDEYEMVEVGRLIPAPYNPNQGDLGAIIESIKANGFYGALVVQRSTRHVLAGNHRLHAANTLGYDRLPVTWVDVSDDAAKRILAVDNHSNRLGNDNPAALAELLTELAGTDKGLEGSGFNPDDLDTLLNELSGAKSLPNLDASPVGVPEQYLVLITCSTERAQSEALESLLEQGYHCRALTS